MSNAPLRSARQVESCDMAQEIREYLESLITSAREGHYIFPPRAASEKIANEIERRTKLKVQNLAEQDVETIERAFTFLTMIGRIFAEVMKISSPNSGLPINRSKT